MGATEQRMRGRCRKGRRSDKNDEALQACDKAIEIDPKSEEAWIGNSLLLSFWAIKKAYAALLLTISGRKRFDIVSQKL